MGKGGRCLPKLFYSAHSIGSRSSLEYATRQSSVLIRWLVIPVRQFTKLVPIHVSTESQTIKQELNEEKEQFFGLSSAASLTSQPLESLATLSSVVQYEIAHLTSALCLEGSYGGALELHQLILYATRKAFGAAILVCCLCEPPVVRVMSHQTRGYGMWRTESGPTNRHRGFQVSRPEFPNSRDFSSIEHPFVGQCFIPCLILCSIP
jgi:hypothetical protein